MIWRAFLTLCSMLFRPARLAGRSWQVEFTTRMVRRLFKTATNKPPAWLNRQLDKIPVSKALLARVETRQQDIAGVPCLVVEPLQGMQPDAVIVYLHGGGYVSGSPTSYLGWVAQLAVAGKYQVVVPDYRLSPEHPFPAAQDDCRAVVAAVIESRASDQDPGRLILMGDSAGGALSIYTALAGEDGNTLAAEIDKLVLISPWVDPTANSGSVVENAKHDIFSHHFLVDAYARHLQGADPANRSTNFRDIDLSGLPQTYVQLGDAELFVDQIREFTGRARQQGCELTVDEFSAMPHDFQILVPGDTNSRQAVEKIVSFARAAR